MEICSNLLLSLECMTLVVLARTLWNKDSVRDLVDKFNYRRDWDVVVKDWVRIELKVLEYANLIRLPDVVKCELSNIIKPIGYEILTWMDFHMKCCDFVFRQPKAFCWSSAGTIDRKATALMILQDDTLDAVIRYEFACVYCFKGYIRSLREQLGGLYKYALTHEKGNSFWVKFWTCQMKEHVASSNGRFMGYTFRSIFQYYDVSRNKTAVEYILQHLISEERDDQLPHVLQAIVFALCSERRTACVTDMLNNLFCIFSHIKPDQRVAVCARALRIEQVPSFVVEYFLNWPLQELFMKAANKMKNILRNRDNLHLASAILRKIEDDWNDYNYEHLYVIFFEQLSDESRKWLIRKLLIHCFSGVVFPLIGSGRSLKIILRSLRVSEKQALALDPYFLLYFSHELFRNGREDLVELFLDESITSPDILQRCRNALINTSGSDYQTAGHRLLMLLDYWND